MKNNDSKQRHLVYFFVIFFIAIAYVSFLIIQPFITAIASAVVLAYIFYPLYDKINHKIQRKSLSAFLVSFLIVLLVSIPLLFLANIAIDESKQVRNFYIIAKDKISTGFVESECTGFFPAFCELTNEFNKFITTPEFRTYIDATIFKTTTTFIDILSAFFFSIPFLLFSLIVIMFMTYYFLKDGKDLANRIRRMLPLKPHHQREIMLKFEETTFALVYGQIVIALVQGIVLTVVFALTGVSPPMFWGLIVTIAALIPIIGSSIIWIPATIIKFMAGNFTAALIILLVGALMSWVDTFVKPKIIGDRSKIHPVIILLGAIGGIKYFGIIGFILGPIVLALFMIFIKIYEREKSEISS